MDAGLFEIFALPFMGRALATVAVLAVAAGIVGLGISFRELEFVSDGLVHAVFPGLVIGAALGGTAGVLPGALLAALITAVLFAVLGGIGVGGSRRGLGSDATIAVLLTGLFSLGIVLVSKRQGYVAQVQELLFGRLLTVTSEQFWQILIVAIVAVGLMLVTARAQLFRAFDSEGAAAVGLRPLATDLALAISVALLVVAGVQALGVLMVLALLTVPMAAARLVTRRFALLVPIAVLVPLVAGALGLWLAFDWSVRAGASVSPGAVVVLVLIAVYALAVLGRAISGGLRGAR